MTHWTLAIPETPLVMMSLLLRVVVAAAAEHEQRADGLVVLRGRRGRRGEHQDTAGGREHHSIHHGHHLKIQTPSLQAIGTDLIRRNMEAG